MKELPHVKPTKSEQPLCHRSSRSREPVVENHRCIPLQPKPDYNTAHACSQLPNRVAVSTRHNASLQGAGHYLSRMHYMFFVVTPGHPCLGCQMRHPALEHGQRSVSLFRTIPPYSPGHHQPRTDQPEEIISFKHVPCISCVCIILRRVCHFHACCFLLDASHQKGCVSTQVKIRQLCLPRLDLCCCFHSMDSHPFRSLNLSCHAANSCFLNICWAF